MSKLNLKWGHPDFMNPSRPALLLDPSELVRYSPDYGTLDLYHDIKDLAYWQSGRAYKHIILTNGATQATNVLLRLNAGATIDHNPMCFPFWQDMIKKAGCRSTFLASVNVAGIGGARVTLVDSPSNATGALKSLASCDWWDAAYNSPVYTKNMSAPAHEVMIGSASKILGVPGLRIGWIGTDNSELAARARQEVLLENATLSHASQLIFHTIYQHTDLDTHASIYKHILDGHRQLFQTIRSFSGVDVNENGMFFTFEADQRQKDILEQRGIAFHDYGHAVRLNMGAGTEVVQEFVKRMKGA